MHPQFQEVLSALRHYKEKHPDCEIRIGTNGYGDHVNRILSRLPEWVKVVNSGKTSNQNTFQSYYVAPIDVDRLKGDDFSRGCYVIEICGLSLNRYGYYCCSPGANVDRVFGFDIGVKSLLSLTDDMLKGQLRRLCGYCGHYKYNYREEYVTDEEISPCWQSAFERYREKHPELTLF